MGKKPSAAAAAADEDFDEVFTDLQGNPDTGADGDDDLLDRLSSTDDAPPRKGGKADDEDKPLVLQDEADEILEADDDEDAPNADAADAAEESETEETQPQVDIETERALFDADLNNFILSAQNVTMRRDSATEAKARAERTLQQGEKDLEAAMEAGDSKRQLAVQKDILDARDVLRNASTTLASVAGEEARLRANYNKRFPGGHEANHPDVVYRETQQRQAAPKAPAWTSKFIAANKWMNEPKHKATAEVLRSIDRALAAEGKIPKNDPKYADELARRFNRVQPGLVRDLEGKLVATGERRRGNGRGGPVTQGTGGTGSNNRSGRTAPSSGQFTKQDAADMAKFGLDAKNMAHRKQWVREGKALDDAERRRMN